MVELAQRVPARSPPSNETSTASAFVPDDAVRDEAMSRTLSVSALISSREYIRWRSGYIMNLNLSRFGPFLLSVLRMVAAALFIQHGTQKLFNMPDGHGTAALFSQLWIAGVIEMFGGTLLLLGLFTRP